MKMELSEKGGGQKTPSTLKFVGKIGLFNYINIKNKQKYQLVGTVIKSNSKKVGGGKIGTPNTKIHGLSLN